MAVINLPVQTVSCYRELLFELAIAFSAPKPLVSALKRAIEASLTWRSKRLYLDEQADVRFSGVGQERGCANPF